MPIPADVGQPQAGKTKKSFSIKQAAIPVVIFVVLIFAVGIAIYNYEQNPPLQCRFAGGSWRDFGTENGGCKDYCYKLNSDPAQCVFSRWTDGSPADEIKAMRSGCDCGPTRCWDAQLGKCVSNPK